MLSRYTFEQRTNVTNPPAVRLETSTGESAFSRYLYLAIPKFSWLPWGEGRFE